MAMGEDLPLLSMLSRKTRGGVPAVAILVQAVVATVMLWTETFETVVKFVQFSLTFCSFLAVLGVIVLRCTRPELPRPYRVWAYPLPPSPFSRHVALHDDLSLARAAAGGTDRRGDHADRPVDLLRVVDWSAPPRKQKTG